jgi:hypothetical protein
VAQEGRPVVRRYADLTVKLTVAGTWKGPPTWKPPTTHTSRAARTARRPSWLTRTASSGTSTTQNSPHGWIAGAPPAYAR